MVLVQFSDVIKDPRPLEGVLEDEHFSWANNQKIVEFASKGRGCIDLEEANSEGGYKQTHIFLLAKPLSLACLDCSGKLYPLTFFSRILCAISGQLPLSQMFQSLETRDTSESEGEREMDVLMEQRWCFGQIRKMHSKKSWPSKNRSGHVEGEVRREVLLFFF